MADGDLHLRINQDAILEVTGLSAFDINCYNFSRCFLRRAAAVAFLVEAKSENTRVFEISARVEGPQMVKINPEPSSTARLIACVASAR